MITNNEHPFYYDLKGHGKSRTYKETYNDVLILKLDSPLKFNKNIQKVCLPADGRQHDYWITEENENQTNCWQSGWQFEKKSEPSKNILRYKIAYLFY